MERTYLEKHLGVSPHNKSFICKKHLVEARRHGHEQDHVPSWKTPSPNSNLQCSKQQCGNPHCSNVECDNLIKPMFTTSDKLKELFGIEPTGGSFVLCRKCYNATYAAICGSQSKPCSSCGAKPKRGTAFCRYSPDAEKVSQHLSDQTGQNVTISPTDYICSTCYKVHCSIIESLRTPHGSDTSLKQAIDQWVDKYNDDNANKLTKAILQTVVYVANHLLLEQAVLLPWACKVFLQSYESEYAGSVTSAKVTVETGDSIVTFSGRWLLHHLIEYLNCYMLYKCVHMKFGTILYRKGVDVLVSLSWALSSVQGFAQKYTDGDHMCVHGPIIEDNKTVLHNAACIVNSLIHDEIERQSTIRQDFSTNPLSFSIEDELQNMNQLLLEFVDRITATVREMKHQTLRKESKASKQLKNIRMYNVLSLLQFCTNPNQPLLFHDLLADAVEMCGGSRELLKILNKLGCTSSPDTHDRFVAHHAEAFIANYGHSTPVQLYNSIDSSLPSSEQHQCWLQKIRQTVSNRIVNEEERVPTYTSLWRHWLRSCWVHQMWQRSIHADMYSSLSPPEHSGWTKDGDTFAIDWEDTEVMSKIRGTINFLTKGCSCKKGCATNNCGCRKKSNHCGPGCECRGCINLPLPQDPATTQDTSDDEDNSTDDNDSITDSENNSEECEDLETEVITDYLI